MGMYGWLESGGSTSIAATSFFQTTPQDIVLRTSYTTNKLVFGNSNNTLAAMYIVGNNVGISKIPETTLDVHGDIECDSVFTLTTNPNCNLATSNIAYRIDASSSNIDFIVQTDQITNSNEHRSMFISSYGILANRITLSDQIKVRGSNVSFFLKDVYPNYQDDHVTTGYTMMTNASYQDFFVKDNSFLIDDIYFFQVVNSIADTNCNLTVNIKMSIPEQNAAPFPLYKDSNIGIQLLKNINPIEDMPMLPNLIEVDVLHRNAIVTSFEYSPDTAFVTFDITLNYNGDAFFNARSHYHIKTIKSPDTMSLIPDNILFLEHVQTIENIGDKTKLKLTFRSPELNASVKPYVQFLTDKLDIISQVAIVIFPLETPMQLGFDIPKLQDVEVLQGPNVIDAINIEYRIKSNVFVDLYNKQWTNNYLDKFIYILDFARNASGIWKAMEFTPDSLDSGTLFLKSDTPFDTTQLSLIYNLGRTVKILPFRYAYYNVIGDKSKHAYIPHGTKLGIATHDIGETLTVGGSASVRDHFFMYNKESQTPLHFEYKNDVLDMQDSAILLSQSNIVTNAPVNYKERVYITSIPDPDHETRFDGRYMASTFQDTSNVLIDAWGVMDAHLANVMDVCAPYKTLENIELIGIEFPAEFQDRQMKYHKGIRIALVTSIQSAFLEGDVLRIAESLFKLVRIDSDVEDGDRKCILSLDWYFSQEQDKYELQGTMPFQVLSRQNIAILRKSHASVKDVVHVPILVKSYTYVNQAQLNITCSIDSPNITFLSTGSYYSLSPIGHWNRDVDNVVILRDMTPIRPGITSGMFTLQFKAVDNQTDLDNKTSIGECMSYITQNTENAYIYLQPLETCFANYPMQTETNITLGFAAEHNDQTYLIIRNANVIQSYFTEYLTSPIDRLIFDDSTYEIAGVFSYDNHLLAKAKYVTPNLIRPYSHATMSYAFNGIPLHVVTATFPANDTTAIFTIDGVDDDLLSKLRAYISHSIYVMDKYNKILHVVNVERRDVETQTIVLTLVDMNHNATPYTPTDYIHFSRPHFMFVVPIKYRTYSILGDFLVPTPNYIPNAVSIGTQSVKEMLTVGGNASVRDALIINNDDSGQPMNISYCNNVLKMNDRLSLSTSNMTTWVDIDVFGFVTARNYYTYSDRRLKKNIQSTDPQEDLKLIQGIDIRQFEFVDPHQNNGSIQRGVIAQDIEECVPQLVNTYNGYLPNIFCDAKTGYDGKSIRIVGKPNIAHDIDPKDILLIKTNNQRTSMSVHVQSVQTRGDTCVIFLDETIPLNEAIFVYGKLDECKVVDTNYLFMTCVNAVKALAQEVASLKETVSKIK